MKFSQVKKDRGKHVISEEKTRIERKTKRQKRSGEPSRGAQVSREGKGGKL